MKTTITVEKLAKMPVDLIYNLELRSDFENKNIIDRHDGEVHFISEGSINSNPKTWAIDSWTKDGLGDINSYLYESKFEYEQDLEVLGFYDRTYVLFGTSIIRAYDNNDNMLEVSKEIKNNNGAISMYDGKTHTALDLLEDFSGWDEYQKINLTEARQLNALMNSNQEESTLNKDVEVRALDFVEKYYPKYYSSQKIAELNDLYVKEENESLDLNERRYLNTLESQIYEASILEYLKQKDANYSKIGEEYFYKVIKPNLVQKAIDGKLDGDMNELYI